MGRNQRTADTKLVDKLLQLGVDPNASNKSGETALAWALRRGHTPVVESLRAHGASDTAIIRQSVEKSIALLQKSGPEFVKVSGCSSCHHQSLPQMAFAVAREHGFAVDPQIAQQQMKAVVAMFKPMREQMMQGKENFPDPAISVSYSLIGLAAEGYAPDPTTEAMAHLVSTQQTADGNFRTIPGRPPIESSVISATALSLRALQLYGDNPEQPVLRARNWLLSASPATTEERVMQLLGLAWAEKRRNRICEFPHELCSPNSGPMEDGRNCHLSTAMHMQPVRRLSLCRRPDNYGLPIALISRESHFC